MNKSTKGALAAAVAGVLLLGGGGTLAYWNATAPGTGVSVTAGELKIANNDCQTADWVFDGSEVTADKVYAAGDLLVPGDVLTKTCSFDITATGEHLRASLAVTNPTLSGALASALTVDSTFEIGGATVPSEITEANNGNTVDAVITLTFLGASDNTTQALAGPLSDFNIALTQVHN